RSVRPCRSGPVPTASASPTRGLSPPADPGRRSEGVAPRLLAHAAGFEFFTGSTRTQVVPTDFFSKVAHRLALLLRRSLTGGDAGPLLLPDSSCGRHRRQLRLRLLVNRLGPVQLVVLSSQVIEELGIELLDPEDQVGDPVPDPIPH